MINLVQAITPDGRPMEGTTCPKHPALGVSLDSGLMEELLCPEPLEQSVLGALMRPDETDRPERPVLALQLYHEQSCFQSSARPMLDPNIVNHTDVNDDIDMYLPESPAPMMNSPTTHKRSCFNSSAWPTLDPEIVNHTYDNSDIDTDLPENSAPMMILDLILNNNAYFVPIPSEDSELIPAEYFQTHSETPMCMRHSKCYIPTPRRSLYPNYHP